MELASLAISILMLAGLAWVASDSLSLTRSWRELKESEAQHRAILNIFPDPLFRLNREGKFLGFYNDKPGSLYIQDDQIVGKNVRESLPQEVSALIEEKIEQTLENGEIQVFEFELPWPDEMKSYETRSVATGDDEVLAIVRNITESKRAEEDLRTTTSRLTALIVNLQAGILVEDSSRRIALVNQAFCDMFGIPAPPQALVGADCSNAAEESKGLFAEPERFVERIDELLRERHLAAGVLPPVPRTPDSSLRN
ncbi:PAS domain S-box protein [bacterium]|nr:PAS domain S-box protein [bacterium]